MHNLYIRQYAGGQGTNKRWFYMGQFESRPAAIQAGRGTAAIEDIQVSQA